MSFLSGRTSLTTVQTGDIAANAVTLAKLAGGTDGNLITYDASGDPAAVATGSDGQVLTSGGAGVAPTFAAGGKVAQVATASNTTAFSITAVIPYDDTIPQNSEGTEIETVAITPTNSSSTLIITAHVPNIKHNTTGTTNPIDGVHLALFVDTTANAIAVAPRSFAYYTGEMAQVYGGCMLIHTLSAASTDARTYKIRLGVFRSLRTIYVNQAAYDMGEIGYTNMTVTEVLP